MYQYLVYVEYQEYAIKYRSMGATVTWTGKFKYDRYENRYIEYLIEDKESLESSFKYDPQIKEYERMI